MKLVLLRLERRARYLLGFAAFAMVFALTAYEMGWISAMPAYPYKDSAWYLQSRHAGVIVINEYQDEFECQQHASVTATCRSGKSLIDEANQAPSNKS